VVHLYDTLPGVGLLSSTSVGPSSSTTSVGLSSSTTTKVEQFHYLIRFGRNYASRIT